MTIATNIAKPGKAPAQAVSALGGGWSCVGMIVAEQALKAAQTADCGRFVRQAANGSGVQR